MTAPNNRARSLKTMLVATSLALGTTIVPSICLASKTFVPTVENTLGISQIPVKGQGCMLCHRSDVGGTGTATQPFGRTLTSRYQLGAGDVGALAAALMAIRTNRDDSDRDGATDYEELVSDGTNPNDPKDHREFSSGAGGEGGSDGAGGASCLIPEPPTFPELRYGCGFSAGSSPTSRWLLGFLL